MIKTSGLSQAISQLRELGCVVTHSPRTGHYRVTYGECYVGALSGSASDINGARNSVRKIGRRINRLNETGRSFVPGGLT